MASSFLILIMAYPTLRWMTYEPYVIPSESMMPSLLVQDYILAEKWSFGLRIPFTRNWLVGPFWPERGDVVIFTSKEQTDVVFVKRVVGLPGDEILLQKSGQVVVNGEPLSFRWSHYDKSEQTNLYYEGAHKVQYEVKPPYESDQTFRVGPDEVFVMGDNRDNSSDSRYWGGLPLSHLLGKVRWIWLSCANSGEGPGNMLCPSSQLRWDRIFTKVN